ERPGTCARQERRPVEDARARFRGDPSAARPGSAALHGADRRGLRALHLGSGGPTTVRRGDLEQLLVPALRVRGDQLHPVVDLRGLRRRGVLARSVCIADLAPVTGRRRPSARADEPRLEPFADAPWARAEGEGIHPRDNCLQWTLGAPVRRGGDGVRVSRGAEAALGRGALLGAVALFIGGCGGAGGGRVTGSTAGVPGEAGSSAPNDAGMTDAGTTDAGTTDAGPVDSGPETTPSDAGSSDAGSPVPDGGAPDGGAVDAGAPDGGSDPDGGVLGCRPAPEPPLASCDELMPTQPLDPPRRFLGPTLSSADDPICLPGAFSGDRDGLLGVMRTLAEDQNRRVSRFELDLLSPDGTLLRGPARDTSPFVFVVPLTQGAGVIRTDGDDQGTLVRIDATGATSELAVG